MASTSTTVASTSSKKFNLKSRDGDIFEVDEAVALESQTIKHMIDDNCADDTGIPLPNVTSQILAKVIEYCKKHVDVENCKEKPGEDVDLKAWDAEFVKVDQDTLYELLLAANYLDIKSLLDLIGMAIADTMVDKTIEEVRTMFNIVNDLTQEEEEEIRRENKWAFE